jgi:quercetin dioxygenase-like cupin family protein
MSHAASAERVAHIVDPRTAEAINVLGPTIQFLTPLEGSQDAPCVMRGTIPPGGVVPLHSHADPETFLALSGELDGLVHSAHGVAWARIEPGDVFHVPGEAKHAFRNRSQAPAVMIVIGTTRIGRFFREVGAPDTEGGPPSAEAIEHFLQTAERYGYWNATPGANAEIGIRLPDVD